MVPPFQNQPLGNTFGEPINIPQNPMMTQNDTMQSKSWGNPFNDTSLLNQPANQVHKLTKKDSTISFTEPGSITDSNPNLFMDDPIQGIQQSSPISQNDTIGKHNPVGEVFFEHELHHTFK